MLPAIILVLVVVGIGVTHCTTTVYRHYESNLMDEDVPLRAASGRVLAAAPAQFPGAGFEAFGRYALDPEWHTSLGTYRLRCALPYGFSSHMLDTDRDRLRFVRVQRNGGESDRVDQGVLKDLQLGQADDELDATPPFMIVELRDGAWHLHDVPSSPDTADISPPDLIASAASALASCALAGISATVDAGGKPARQKIMTTMAVAFNEAVPIDWLYEEPATSQTAGGQP